MLKSKTLRVMSLSAMAMAFAFCGCSNEESTPDKNASPAVSARQASSRRAFSPKVLKDASLTLGVSLNREMAYKILDTYSKRLTSILDLDQQMVDEMQGKIAEFKKDPFKDAPGDVQEFLNRTGLRDVEFDWAVFSVMGPLDIICEKEDMGGLCLAIACNIDLEKVIDEFKKKMAEESDDDISFKKVSVDGETAWHIVPNDSSAAREMRENNVDPHLASLDGKLVLLTMSSRMLSRQIRLYRKSEGEGDALKGFSAAENDLAHLSLSGIGRLIQQAAPADELKKLSEQMPNGEEIAKELRSLDIDIKATPDGTTRQSIVLEAATEKDADAIRTLVKSSLDELKAQIQNDKEAPKALAKMLTDIEIGGTDGKVEVLNTDLMLTLGAALFPAISSAMLSASTSAMSMRGRNLFVGITQANIDRESHGRDSIWPRTVPAEGADKDDITGKAFTSAADYFAEVFDIEKYGSSDWSPYVDVDVSTLGKDAVAGKTIRAAGLEWCVAANVTDDMPDNIPVLVSANFNPSLLLRKWDGRNRSEPLPIGPASGAEKSMFGDKAIVVVYKGGSCRVIKKKYLNYDSIYGEEFDTTHGEHPLVYLTPSGIAKPSGTAKPIQ